MKINTKVIRLLITFFVLVACNVLTPALTPTTAPSTQEVVLPTQMTDEEAIRAALASHLGANASELTVVIEQNTGTHAKGSVENGYFLAAKVDDQWQIVADGQAMPDCTLVAQYNFPLSMVPECITPTCSPAESDEEAIRAALAAHLGTDASALTIVITQNTGAHAKGSVENGYFLAAKVDGRWQIVADGQAMPDCALVGQYGFPPSMVPECQEANSINEIHFKPGGTSASVQKTMRAGEQHSYKIQGMANQTMIVGVSSDQNDVFLGIKGVQGGQQLLPTSAHTSYWTGTLPQTQDYIITLTTNNPNTKYFMDVVIPAIIHFEPGTYSTVVDGHIEILDPIVQDSVGNFVTYLLYASAGQTLDVELSSPHLDALSFGVYGQTDGQPYRRWQVKNYGYYGVLPLTQGYYLKVFSNGATTDFTLKITIN
jgi:hypothetical protein